MSDGFDWDKVPLSEVVGVDPAIEVQPGVLAYSISVPAGQEWRPQDCYASLTTSADAANRAMYLMIYTGPATTAIYVSELGLVITASQTKTQSWMRDSQITAAGTQYGMHMPDLVMKEDWNLRFVVNNFDAVAAGDNATALTAHVQVAPA